MDIELVNVPVSSLVGPISSLDISQYKLLVATVQRLFDSSVPILTASVLRLTPISVPTPHLHRFIRRGGASESHLISF